MTISVKFFFIHLDLITYSSPEIKVTLLKNTWNNFRIYGNSKKTPR